MKSPPSPLRRLLISVLGPPAVAYVSSRFPLGRERAARLGMAYAFARGLDFRKRLRFGALAEGNTRNLLDTHLFLFGEWEPHISDWMASRLAPGDVFIDVGANLGYYTLLASRRVGPSGKVIAVEASPSIGRHLRRNVEINSGANVVIHNVAASDRPEVLRLFKGPPGNPAETTTAAAAGFELECEVPAVRLDSVISPDDFRRARILKLDIEGAEHSALRGLTGLLGTTHPDLEILAEANVRPRGEGASRASDLITLLAAFGFHPYEVENPYTLAPYVSRRPKARPRRVRTGLEERCDLVFSRRDVEEL